MTRHEIRATEMLSLINDVRVRTNELIARAEHGEKLNEEEQRIVVTATTPGLGAQILAGGPSDGEPMHHLPIADGPSY